MQSIRHDRPLATRGGDMRSASRELFRHVGADKAVQYRSIMDVFASASRQYRLQLRPDEVLAEASWPDAPPRIEDVTAALVQLALWGNLETQPDTARVANLSDFYRARFLYRLSPGGEAVEAALVTFLRTLGRRAELQTVTLEDIGSRLQTLQLLADASARDTVKIHEILRDLMGLLERLAGSAQAFMAGLARSIEFQQADAQAVIDYKHRLIEYLERFLGDLVHRTDTIGRLILQLTPHIEELLLLVAEREARDAAPGQAAERDAVLAERQNSWRERWTGLRGWFLNTGHTPPQADLLRARARSAIPQLLGAVASLNERRSGRSDRSADFRRLAIWFADCRDDDEAHRLGRAAFALNPARHFSLITNDDALPASTPWAAAPPLVINPRLREFGEAVPRGPPPRVQDRSAERALLARRLAEETQQIEAARRRFATGRPIRFSDLDTLDRFEFELFLGFLAEALAEQATPDTVVERRTGDGLLLIRLEPLGVDTHARIATPAGVFAGRDHVMTLSPVTAA